MVTLAGSSIKKSPSAILLSWIAFYHLQTQTLADLILEWIHFTLLHCRSVRTSKLIFILTQGNNRKKPGPHSVFFLDKSLYLAAGSSFYRSSLPEVFYKKGVLRNFAKITENTCARVSFLIELQAWGTGLESNNQLLL